MLKCPAHLGHLCQLVTGILMRQTKKIMGDTGMTIKELAEQLAEEIEAGNGDDVVAVWTWGADGQKIYAPHTPLNKHTEKSATWGNYRCILNYDLCMAHMITD